MHYSWQLSIIATSQEDDEASSEKSCVRQTDTSSVDLMQRAVRARCNILHGITILYEFFCFCYEIRHIRFDNLVRVFKR